MSTLAEIRRAVSQLEPGVHVRIRLDDGTEHEGIVVEGEFPLELVDGEAELDPERIERILLDPRSGGPE
jgi:hypothetical protein